MMRATVPIALACLALAGCGGGDSDDDESRVQTAPPPPERQSSGPAPTAPPPTGDGRGGVTLVKIGDFEAPVHIAEPPGADGSTDLYVVEQAGRIRVVRDGELLDEPFLDISDQVVSGGEQGLLSIAFAPDYPRTGLFYVDYTDSNGDSRIVEFRRSEDDPHRADPESARELLFVDQPFDNHNGGLVLFGPDGNLYIGFGDGGSGGDPDRNGQDLGTLLGKILRIDPRPGAGRPYRIPADNPFAGRPGAAPEIYAYGLRNPWRFSFDPETDALFVGDVGEDEQEEIDAGVDAGDNLGWSAFEGTATYNEDESAPGHLPPVLTYGRGRGCSVTGGHIVRDPELTSLYGRYVYGDYCLGELRSFRPAGGEVIRAVGDRPLGPTVPALSSFGLDATGRLYATSLEGPVYRLDPQ
jgi:glucose/arabinose dehydrogenase